MAIEVQLKRYLTLVFVIFSFWFLSDKLEGNYGMLMSISVNNSASFTAGALLYNEFIAVTNLLQRNDFVALLDEEARKNELLKVKTEAARVRIVTEIKKRARAVAPHVWHLLPTLRENEQRLLLYYVVLKAYPLARDFHFEVVLKKWRMMQNCLDKYDLQMRIDEISSNDEEVAGWSESTKNKTLTQFIRMLRECGLMRTDTLVKPDISMVPFWSWFGKWDEPWFLDACFFTKNERDLML